MSLDPNIFFALPWERHDMGKTITGTTKLGVTLTANPTIIDGTIATYAEPAIYGSAAKVWTINNNGLISASSEQGVAIRNVYAITLAGGGKITNAAGASIIGYDAGFVAEKSTTIINAGTIAATQGQSTGIALSAGGAVTNSAAGVIAGVLVGVSGGSTFSLLNQGVIYTTIARWPGGSRQRHHHQCQDRHPPAMAVSPC